jgi:hypothetical protein
MGIDDIKPPGFYGSFVPVSSEAPIESKRDNSFSEVKGKPEPPASESARLSLGAAADLKKADLQDPAKLEQIVRSSASELVDSQSLSGPLSTADKKSLVDFLSQDPMFRQQIESYLRKVAV